MGNQPGTELQRPGLDDTAERMILARQLPKRTLALVLAGGRGSRLHDLTDRRAKPAVHFGGKFRIIDFALSNCINSGIRRIGVVTQYKSHSLLRHLQAAGISCAAKPTNSSTCCRRSNGSTRPTGIGAPPTRSTRTSTSCAGTTRNTSWCWPGTTRHNPYWRDVGTVDAFWSANLDLASNMPELNIYDREWPVWTYQEQLPPAKFVPDERRHNGETANTMVSGGCIVSGSDLRESVLFSNVRVHSRCPINQVVIDRGCKLPEGLVIGDDAELDARRFYRTADGVVLVTKAMLDKL